MRARPFAFDAGPLRLAGELVVPEQARGVLILCHGLPSGRPSDPTDPGYPGLARDLAGRGYAALWFDFRGCRSSPGDFSASGWCADLEAAVDAVRATEEVRALPLVLVGSSAGGATAITVGARRQDVAMVATFAAPASYTFAGLVADPRAFLQELRNAGTIRDPSFPRDVDAWVEDLSAAAPERHVALLAPRPLLLVHGDADTTVGYQHAERLFEAARPPKELVRLTEGGHQLRRDPRALDVLTDWLERNVSGPLDHRQ